MGRMPTPSVGLLTFSRDNVEDVLELVRDLRSEVDEVLVVDSSSPDSWDRIDRGIAAMDAVRVRVLPTGYMDLLLPFGVHELRSEWVLRLDPDERPSRGLLDRLGRLGDSDGFVIPRWEVSWKAYTHHLRLFRKSRFGTPSPAYGFPEISGRLDRLPRSECVIHRRSYGTKLSADYTSRVMDIESWERPLDSTWLKQTVAQVFPRRTSVYVRPAPPGKATSLAEP